jgi:hypothetical protein
MGAASKMITLKACKAFVDDEVEKRSVSPFRLLKESESSDFVDFLLLYRVSHFGFKIVSDRGQIWVEIAPLEREGQIQFFLITDIAVLLGQEQNEGLLRQIHFFFDNLSNLADLFSEEKRNGTILSLEKIQKERVDRLFSKSQI